MNDHFIKNIEIKNFKCFEDFKAEGFGRVNLIGGKNNVGKTAFMEALFLSDIVENQELEQFLNKIVSIEFFRDYLVMDKLISELSINENIKFTINLIKRYFNTKIFTERNRIEVKINNKVELQVNNENYILPDDMSYLFHSVEYKVETNFISSLFIDNSQLEILFDGVKRNRKRAEVNNSIQLFDNKLVEYDIIDDTPVCFSNIDSDFIKLAEYGHGLKRYITYICAIWANQNAYVFIDEIENGIHSSNLDKLWEIILKTSKEANCQVFATTHSKECIESYARVAKELEDNEITFFKLGHNKKGELKGMIYPYDWFVDSVEQEQELRGW